MRRRLGRVLLAAVVLLMASCGVALAASPAMETRVFRLRWRSVEDAAVLVRPPLCSEDARIQMEPKLRTLTLTDWPHNLESVGQAIASFDVPPRAVDVTVTLIRATRPSAPRPIPDELRTIKDSVDNVMPYSDYEVLGSAQLSGVEGTKVTTLLGNDEYRVAFAIGAADERNGTIRFDDLALDRRRTEGARRGEFGNLMTLTYQAQSGRKVVLGATRAAAKDTGVLLVIEPTILPPAEGTSTLAGGRK